MFRTKFFCTALPHVLIHPIYHQDGTTALMFAGNHDHASIVETLIKKEADLDVSDKVK